MDSVIYPGTETLWPNNVGSRPEPSFIDLSSQNELYQRNVFDRRRSSLTVSQSGRCSQEPQQSTSSRGEMNFNQVPVVDNSFSLPRNVFERALASQTRVSITAPSSAGFSSPFMNDSSAPPITYGQQQRRRSSGDYVTEFTGSEAKRPRLSPPTTERDFKRLQREQMKLQILRRLDHTKDNILKLLKLQHMQELVHYYEKDPRSDQANSSGSFQRREAQYHSRQGSAYERQNGTPNLACVQNDPRSVPAFPKRNVSVPYTAIRGPSHISSTSQSLRRVPGINIIEDGVQSNAQRTSSYSYKSSDSVGLAWDHKALPKIVAVHSVIRDKSGKTAIPVSRSLLGAAVAAQMKRSYDVGNPHEKSEVRQNQPQSPGSSKVVIDCEDDEVVLTKVLPGRSRRSLSTERKRVETNVTKPNESAANERERSPNRNQVNRQSFAQLSSIQIIQDMLKLRD
ncbi:hypothetical protein ACROYT_G027630 [Oculina patagonica]